MLMDKYSDGMYPHAMNVTHIHIEDTCLEHVTVYIFTKDYGILMLNVLKETFYTELWKHTEILLPTENQNTDKNSDPSSLMLSDHHKKTIIYSGRLLANYYNFDFSDSLFAVNTRMMGMLIKIKYEGGYHMYSPTQISWTLS